MALQNHPATFQTTLTQRSLISEDGFISWPPSAGFILFNIKEETLCPLLKAISDSRSGNLRVTKRIIKKFESNCHYWSLALLWSRSPDSYYFIEPLKLKKMSYHTHRILFQLKKSTEKEWLEPEHLRNVKLLMAHSAVMCGTTLDWKLSNSTDLNFVSLKVRRIKLNRNKRKILFRQPKIKGRKTKLKLN